MTTISPDRIRVGLFGLQALQQLDTLPQIAILHDLAHGVELPVTLSPGRVDELAAHGIERAAALADSGVDPDTLDIETWWGLVNQSIQLRQQSAAHALAVQDGANPPAPSRA
tara:strand:+ start:316 stop:651 length:336 start_codon:yes stop_codon:yes gene_type:complete